MHAYVHGAFNMASLIELHSEGASALCESRIDGPVHIHHGHAKFAFNFNVTKATLNVRMATLNFGFAFHSAMVRDHGPKLLNIQLV